MLNAARARAPFIGRFRIPAAAENQKDLKLADWASCGPYAKCSNTGREASASGRLQGNTLVTASVIYD